MKTNRYSLLAALSFTSAAILAVLAIYIVIQPVSVPQNPKQRVPTAEELGFYESGPRPHLFTFYTVFDPTYMIKTECTYWEGRTVILRPNTTVPIKAWILSAVNYDLNVTFTAKLNPMLNKVFFEVKNE